MIWFEHSKSFFLSLVCLICLTGYGQDLSEGLVLYYPFNNDATDYSGNEIHGVENGIVYDLGPGFFNTTSLRLPGDGYVEIPQEESTELELPLTISCWINIDVYSPSILTTDDSENIHSGVWLSTAQGSNALAVNFGDGNTTTGSSRRTFLTDTTLQLGAWHHVVAIVREALDMEVWIGCHQVGGSYSGSGGDLTYTNAGGAIGRKDANTGVPSYYFNGRIDEFYLYDRELTVAEIQTLCNPDFQPNFQVGQTELDIDNSLMQNGNMFIARQSGKLTIFDLTGRLVDTQQLVSGESYFFNSKGLYVVSWAHGSSVISKKVLF